jgi:hypothetical protein
MTVYAYSIILNDAYFYLNQVISLPAIPSAEPLRQRYVRACILFSWIALEELLADDTTGQGKLSVRLDKALELRGAKRLDSKEFLSLRRIRNLLTHPKKTNSPNDDPLIGVEQARATFEYCLKMMRSLSSHEFVVEVGDRSVLKPLVVVRREPSRGERDEG